MVGIPTLKQTACIGPSGYPVHGALQNFLRVEVVVEETNGSSHFKGHFLHSVSVFASCYFFITTTRPKRHNITIAYLERFGNSLSTREVKKNEVCLYFLFKAT